MAYTREAISEPTSAIPTASPQLMKDDAVIDPHARSLSRAAALSKSADIGQADKVGEKAAVESGQPAESVTLSPGAAALARKEQKFRQDELRLKAREAELTAKAAKLQKLEEMEAKLAKDDYSSVEGVIDYDKYTQHLLSKQASLDPNQQAMQKLAAEIESVKKSQEDNITKQFEAAVNERKTAAAKLLETDPELSSFKTRVEKAMPALKLPDVVTQHILDTWEHDSEELSVEQATKEVKEALFEKAKAWSSLIEESEKPPVDEKKQLPPMKPSLKTITNQVTAGEVKTPNRSFQHMNESERYAEARRRALEKLDKQKQGA